ncbi:MAG: hypothetical protein PHG03_04905 [Bacilli bacterium]|nr:hypothetical protein [Bacilli bacterium]
MYKWDGIQTKTELEIILDVLKEKIKDLKIQRIFSFDDGTPRMKNDIIFYNTLEESLYILFDNDYCLIIDFVFYSSIYIEYRKLTKEELNQSISSVSNKEMDYFNSHHEIYSWDFDENRNRIESSLDVKYIVDINGKYDEIYDIQVNGFSHEYDKWISDSPGSSIVTIPAGGDYFDSIKTILCNGIEISVCPQTAYDDGYYDLKIRDPKNCMNFNNVDK